MHWTIFPSPITALIVFPFVPNSLNSFHVRRQLNYCRYAICDLASPPRCAYLLAMRKFDPDAATLTHSRRATDDFGEFLSNRRLTCLIVGKLQVIDDGLRIIRRRFHCHHTSALL